MKQTNWAYWVAGQAGVIPIALGMPGVAKTESTRALAYAARRRFLPVMLDQVLPEDLGGYPVVKEIDHDGRRVEVMRRVLDEKFVMARLEPSVMLIDELTNTGHSTQAAALQLMAEGIRTVVAAPTRDLERIGVSAVLASHIHFLWFFWVLV
jgi:MoxR-like ATPase